MEWVRTGKLEPRQKKGFLLVQNAKHYFKKMAKAVSKRDSDAESKMKANNNLALGSPKIKPLTALDNAVEMILDMEVTKDLPPGPGCNKGSILLFVRDYAKQMDNISEKACSFESPFNDTVSSLQAIMTQMLKDLAHPRTPVKLSPQDIDYIKSLQPWFNDQVTSIRKKFNIPLDKPVLGATRKEKLPSRVSLPRFLAPTVDNDMLAMNALGRAVILTTLPNLPSNLSSDQDHLKKILDPYVTQLTDVVRNQEIARKSFEDTIPLILTIADKMKNEVLNTHNIFPEEKDYLVGLSHGLYENIVAISKKYHIPIDEVAICDLRRQTLIKFEFQSNDSVVDKFITSRVAKMIDAMKNGQPFKSIISSVNILAEQMVKDMEKNPDNLTPEQYKDAMRLVHIAKNSIVTLINQVSSKYHLTTAETMNVRRELRTG